MSTKSKRHVHKYYRVSMNGTDVWACAKPDCMHYMPQHMEKLVNGKSTVCWECGENTFMTPASMADRQPRCDDCRGIMGIEAPVSGPLKNILEGKEANPMTDTAKRIAEFLESQKK